MDLNIENNSLNIEISSSNNLNLESGTATIYPELEDLEVTPIPKPI